VPATALDILGVASLQKTTAPSHNSSSANMQQLRIGPTRKLPGKAVNPFEHRQQIRFGDGRCIVFTVESSSRAPAKFSLCFAQILIIIARLQGETKANLKSLALETQRRRASTPKDAAELR